MSTKCHSSVPSRRSASPAHSLSMSLSIQRCYYPRCWHSSAEEEQRWPPIPPLTFIQTCKAQQFCSPWKGCLKGAREIGKQVNVFVTTHLSEEASLGAWFGSNRPTGEGIGEGHAQSSGRPSISPKSHRQTVAMMREEGAGGSAALPHPTTPQQHTQTHIHKCRPAQREAWWDNQTVHGKRYRFYLWYGNIV